MSSIPSNPASLAARDKMLFLTTAIVHLLYVILHVDLVASSTVIPK